MQIGRKLLTHGVLVLVFGVAGLSPAAQAEPVEGLSKHAVAYAYMQRVLEQCAEDAAVDLEQARKNVGALTSLGGFYGAAVALLISGFVTDFKPFVWGVPVSAAVGFVGGGFAAYFLFRGQVDKHAASSVLGEQAQAYPRCHGLFEVTLESGSVFLQERGGPFGMRCLLDLDVEMDLSSLPDNTGLLKQNVSSVGSLENTILPLPIQYETCELI